MSARVLCVRVWLSCTAHAVRLCVTLRCRFVRCCCLWCLQANPMLHANAMHHRPSGANILG